jgi:hypothetical protein
MNHSDAAATLSHDELQRRAVAIADAAVISDIESECIRTQLDDDCPATWRWYDTRAMLDEREHSPQCIDMNSEALDYALMRGLAVRHPVKPHLVRITRPA